MSVLRRAIACVVTSIFRKFLVQHVVSGIARFFEQFPNGFFHTRSYSVACDNDFVFEYIVRMFAANYTKRLPLFASLLFAVGIAEFVQNAGIVAPIFLDFYPQR